MSDNPYIKLIVRAEKWLAKPSTGIFDEAYSLIHDLKDALRLLEKKE